MDSTIELKIRDGLIMTPPLINDSVLPNMTPAMFHEWFRWRFESSSFLEETFLAIVLARARGHDSSYESGAYYQKIIQKFRSHSDWNYLRPRLDDKEILRYAIVPHSTPNNDLAFFEFGGNRLWLPLVQESLFNLSGLDVQHFINEVLEITPGRLKDLDEVTTLVGAGQFALQRFQGAMRGLDSQFIGQPGRTAFMEHIQNHRAARADLLDFTKVDLHRNAVPWKREMYCRDHGMTIFPLRERRNGDATTVSTPNPASDLLEPFRDENNSILRAQYMTREYGKTLAFSGMALIVSRLSIEEDADSMTRTHFHQLERGPNIGPRSVKLEILGAHNRSIVIPFENGSIKDRVLAHLQHARFDFQDEQNVELDVTQLSEDTVLTTSFVLGSAPIKSLGRLDDALRPIFTNKGYVLTTDVMSYPSHGAMVRTKVIISHAVCPTWLQKVTVTKDGLRDQQIEVRKTGTCKFCQDLDNTESVRAGGPSQPLRRSDTAHNDGNGPQRLPNQQDPERMVAGFQTPVRREMVPDNRKAPRKDRYQDRPVAALRAPFATDNDIDGNKLGQALRAQGRTRSTNESQALAGAGSSGTHVNASNRKPRVSPDASRTFEPRPRLQE